MRRISFVEQTFLAVKFSRSLQITLYVAPQDDKALQMIRSFAKEAQDDRKKGKGNWERGAGGRERVAGSATTTPSKEGVDERYCVGSTLVQTEKHVVTASPRYANGRNF